MAQEPTAYGSLTIDQILAIRSLGAPEAPRWSPDGTRIAFLSGLTGEQELWSISADGGYPARLTIGLGPVAFTPYANPSWSPDGRYISYVSHRSGPPEVWLWPADGSPSRQLTRLGAYLNAHGWAPDSGSIVLSGSRYGDFDLYRVDVPSGRTRRLTTDPLYEVYPTFSPDGRNILYVRLDEHWVDHEVMIIPADGGEGRVIARDTNFFDYHYGKLFGYPVVSPAGDAVLFRSYRSGQINYWKVSPDGGEPAPLHAEAADQIEAAWSPDGKRAAYISYHDGTLSLCVVGRDGRDHQALVDPKMGVCSHPQWSPDGSRISYLFQTPTSPMDLWVVSAADGKTRQLTDSMLGGEVRKRLVTPEKLVYSSFDGESIHAYLYRPPTRDAGERFPGVLFIHGGPTNQWMDGYNAAAQYLAHQGYVVLMPNIRGSSGYGRRFEDLNNRDWGHDDLKDVVAGADYLRTLDYVDPDAIGITGSSYGGFMTMAAVCFAPNVFKAAVAVSGYGDWAVAHAAREQRDNRMLEYELGPFETSGEIYHKCSPVHFARNARTPVLVLCGEGRGLVRSTASHDYFRALEKEYKTVQYKVYPNEGYYILSHANTKQMLLDTAEFFARYLRD